MTNNSKQSLLAFFKFFSKAFFIIFLIFLASLVLNTFLESSKLEKTLLSPGLEENILDAEKLILGDGSNHSIGADDAQIVIVEFADFSCPYCKASFQKIREISTLYNDKVKYIWRDLPIVHDYSLDLALAARCAGEQGLFWQMHDKLFIKQGVKEKQEIYTLAKQVGVDMEKFGSCFDSKKYIPKIQQDFDDAQKLGVHNLGTPIWFINGQVIKGTISDEDFDTIINHLK